MEIKSITINPGLFQSTIETAVAVKWDYYSRRSNHRHAQAETHTHSLTHTHRHTLAHIHTHTQTVIQALTDTSKACMYTEDKKQNMDTKVTVTSS